MAQNPIVINQNFEDWLAGIAGGPAGGNGAPQQDPWPYDPSPDKGSLPWMWEQTMRSMYPIGQGSSNAGAMFKGWLTGQPQTPLPFAMKQPNFPHATGPELPRLPNYPVSAPQRLTPDVGRALPFQNPMAQSPQAAQAPAQQLQPTTAQPFSWNPLSGANSGGLPSRPSGQGAAPNGAESAVDRYDYGVGGADRYYGPPMTNQGGGGGNGNGNGGGGGGPVNPANQDPMGQIWDKWAKISQDNGVDWAVLRDVYLNPNRNGTWGKYGDPEREIASALQEAVQDGVWAEIYGRMYGQPPSEREWVEHYYWKNSYNSQTGQYMYRDPILGGGGEAPHAFAENAWNEAINGMNQQSQNEAAAGYINNIPPGANW